MRIGVEEKSKDVSTIFQILNSYADEVGLEDILMRLIEKNVSSSDLLFLVLQKLRRDGYIDGSKGVLKINNIPEEEMRKVSTEISKELSGNEKLFVTPLEVSKFYTCPRRIFLEKIALSKQFKERFGKTWDGEVIHAAINMFIKTLGKKETEELVEEVVKEAIEKYKERTNLTEEKVKEFILKFNDLVKDENFLTIYTEKTFESFKIGLTGTPDLICIKENGEIVPIDVKLGKLDRRGVKDEHLLQITGESILAEDFFRKNINYSYLIYFESNSLAKIEINDEMKKRLIGQKRKIESILKRGYIPEKSRLYNFRNRVCLGCHVKPACDNIEALSRIYY